MAVEGSIVDECQASERGEPCLEVDEDEPTQERNKCAGCRKIMEEHETKYYGHDDGVPSDQLGELVSTHQTAPYFVISKCCRKDILTCLETKALKRLFAGCAPAKLPATAPPPPDMR